MFIKVKAENLSEIIVNTTQIVCIVGTTLHMSDRLLVHVADESLQLLMDNLFGDVNASSPAASEHTSTLLNDLNKLCGGRGDAKPTTDRKARLKSRLKDFSEDELKTAAKNLGQDEFMQGANESGKRYGTIDYLLRTSANINKWLEDQPEKKKPGMFKNGV